MGFAMVFLAEVAFQEPFWKAAHKVPAILFILFSCVFPVIIVQTAGNIAVRAETVNPYFQMGLTWAVALSFCLKTGQHYPKIRLITGLLSWGILFITILFILSYSGYYYIFHTAFSDDDMKVLLMTNSKEAMEFLLSHAGEAGIVIAAIGIVAMAALFAWYVRKELKENEDNDCGYTRIEKILQLLLVVSCILMMNHWVPRSFPGYEYRKAMEYIHSMKQLETYHKPNLEKFSLEAPEKALAKELPGTVIMIVGETANRDHMKAFNPSYPEETTPWLSAQRKDFFLFTKAYSNYPITMNALFNYLTNMNQYNQKSDKDIVTITDVANKAGYDTYWISNQDKSASVIPLLASASHKELWTKPAMGDDMHVVDLLRQVPRDRNNFIVIHLWGSHDRYKDRVPADFPRFDYGPQTQRVADYDSSIRYVDKVLETIFDYASTNLNLQVMTYCSDHGEDMVRTHHGGPGFTFDMVRVPLFIYLSPAYQERYPEVVQHLSANQNSFFTNDLMFDTISGLLRAPNTEYENRYDLTSDAYQLSVDEALTEGNVHISRDPALK